MSRKHFRLIAAAIATIQDSTVRKQIAEALASVCASCNAEFNRAKFMLACGC